MTTPEGQFDRLRELGLLVSSPFVPTHVGFPGGVRVAKPAGVRGNCVPGYEMHWGIFDDPIIVDAPTLTFHGDAASWIVGCHEYVPGPGPGDFRREFDTADAAADFIVDYFFAKPSQMNIDYVYIANSARRVDPDQPKDRLSGLIKVEKVVHRLERSVGALEMLLAEGRIPESDLEEARSTLSQVVRTLDRLDT